MKHCRFLPIPVLATVTALATAPVQAQTLTTLYSFANGDDGANPTAALTYHDGMLYGTTITGNSSQGGGTVFSLDPVNGTEIVLHKFPGGSSSDGFAPNFRLLYHWGQLYGTTSLGGTSNAGTVFDVNATSGAEKVVYSLRSGSAGSSDGAYPLTATSHGGMLYAVTAQGGTWGLGALVKIQASTGEESVLYSFTGTNAGGSDGKSPNAGLIYYHGFLYGATGFGGAANDGILYAVDPASGTETVLHNFDGTDGRDPIVSLIDFSGNLYGVTQVGGSHNSGTVFKFNIATGVLTTLYNFAGGAVGNSPVGVIKRGNELYGVTTSGGTSNAGTLFSINLSTDAETVLHSFTGGDDGYAPLGLINGGTVLYGVTVQGGVHGYGTVFEFSE